MNQPPSPRRSQPNHSDNNNHSSQNNHSGPAASKGQLHVKLIQARSLSVQSVHAKPYVVVQFEQTEFVSRNPIPESEKEVKGVATTMSRTSSSTALSALGAVNSKAQAQEAGKRSRKTSANTTPQNSVPAHKSVHFSNESPTSPVGGLFGRINPQNAVWKHEVSFDVTSDQSVITFNIYDRSAKDQHFLGMFDIKPVLVHDHTVDNWYKLRPYENEVVTGEMRVQITYEQFKTKRTLTPRDFEFLKLIGRGTFGRVFQVRKKDTKRIYAMKVLSKREIVAKKEVAHTIGERKILQQSLTSPFLVGLKFSFQTDTDLYLVTDFKSGGELFWHLQKETRFTEERARFYIAELVLALEHLHKYDIVYRDLKPENILLDATGHVALCDFGLSKPDLKSDQLTNTFCGTTEYLAPEVLLDDHGYSKLVDFWSLGVLLFEMCCGWSPFYAEDTQQMYKNICFGKIRFPKGVIGEDGKQFVKGLLNRNPKHRLGAQRDAEELKEHPFFKTLDWKALLMKQVTPPFKPVIESDESTANFDPEFTSADIKDPDVNPYDEEDPSEDWVSQSLTSSVHTPNGPLGSEFSDLPRGSPPPADVPPRGTPMQMPGGGRRRKNDDAAGGATPLTRSVQENFRGFSYTGESVVYSNAAGRLRELDREEDEQAVEIGEEEMQEPTTEDEYEDDQRAGGRYARRRNGDEEDPESPML
ncbi:kinase-like protein [Rickenella mellea]|uniref:Kinase-like protein n=1 Tax=Rickenella mellea TaxID=50990 RepID=A0A4R5XGT7_9AGAM|nr:kinase-like protein [Rickenella mellea]